MLPLTPLLCLRAPPSRWRPHRCLLCSHLSLPIPHLLTSSPTFSTSSSPPSRSTSPAPIYRPRRALLYVPASSARMLAKLPSLTVDSLCLDLEDSVADNRKAEARANVVATLAAFASSHRLTSPSTHIPPPLTPLTSPLPPRPPAEVLVRINPIPSPHSADDLLALLSSPHLPHGIVIPKCESLDHLSHVLSTLSSHPSLPSHPLALIALIETPLALLSLPHLTSHPALQTLILGGDDLASALSLHRSPHSTELLSHRQGLVLQGRVRGLQCLDVVRVDLGDEEGLRREVREGWEWGMSGKQVVHPSQVGVVEEEMVGGMERLRWSVRVVESWEMMERKGVGAWRLDGKMIDRPTVRIAQRLLDHARACGVDVGQLQ